MIDPRAVTAAFVDSAATDAEIQRSAMESVVVVNEEAILGGQVPLLAAKT